MNDWRIFTNEEPAAGEDPRARLRTLPAPPWREFPRRHDHSPPLVADEQTIQMVNAAIYLRRPLLVTGKPGTGKSSLAKAIASQLRLDPLLKWPITTRSTLQDGLYRYDALGRLRDVRLETSEVGEDRAQDVARYIRLGPLGTALAASDYPRVLLIDEIDKGDIDLPNDLLHAFEDAEFTIPELTRLLPKAGAGDMSERTVTVQTDDNSTTTVTDGVVRCQHFPIIVMTSNGERDFPPAFLRRCLQLEMQQPQEDALRDIVKRHLGEAHYQQFQGLIGQYVQEFAALRDSAKGDLATDQLLNLIFLMTRDVKLDEQTRASLKKKLLERLSAES